MLPLNLQPQGCRRWIARRLVGTECKAHGLTGFRGDLQAALSAGAIAGYTLAGSGTRLPFLGDLLRVLPGAGPFFGLASVGDLLMGAGVVLVMVRMMTAQKRAQRGAGRQPS